MGVFQVDVDDIVRAVKKWEPKKWRSEALFEKGLYSFLHEKFPREDFHRQYARAKTKADIYVHLGRGGAEVVIEVKYKLTGRAEYHRLIGQTYEYLTEWKTEVLVVVCGKSDPGLLKLADQAVDCLERATGLKARFLGFQQ